jgi:hypothetical protein
VWEVYAEPLQDGLEVLPEVEGVLRVGLAGDHLRTITEKGMKKEVLLKAIKGKNLDIKDTVVGEPTLEDVFISLAR